MCRACNQSGTALLSELEDIINGQATPAVRMVNPKKVNCSNFDRSFPILRTAGTNDPIAALEKIVQRAVEMLNNTISELTRIQGRVQVGDPIGWPLISDTFGMSLAKRMRLKVNDPAAWKGDGPGKVKLVIRWLTRIRDLIASGDLRYTCVATGNCDPDTWAWTFPPTAHNLHVHPKPDFFHIRLCARFWRPAKAEHGKPAVTPEDHFEFQAQTIIHETSHIYYATEDKPGLGPGVAECVSQFVAETNGSPLDPLFMDRCGGPLK
jgi:hypothetical protein